jgi:hypothetical protein
MDHLTRLDTKQARIGILNHRVQPTQPHPLELVPWVWLAVPRR